MLRHSLVKRLEEILPHLGQDADHVVVGRVAHLLGVSLGVSPEG